MIQSRLDTALPLGRSADDFNERYSRALVIVLLGYAILGKTFAYLGIPPLFVGEMALAGGLIALLRSGCWLAILATPASRMLIVLMGWVLYRTVPYLGPYGMDAPRDSVLALYGLFALIVVALLLEEPGRFGRAMDAYGRFARFYALAGGIVYGLSSAFLKIPGTEIQIPSVRAGEAASHLAAIAVFVLLGLGRFSRLWVAVLMASMIVVTSSRGAMLTCLVPVVVAAIAGRRLRQFMPIVLVFFVAAIIATLFDLSVQLPGNERATGPKQIVEGLKSVVGVSEASNFEATKEFRLRWWATIQDYTLRGPYFWTGKGFGVNIALEDGYKQWVTADAVLRSPHNVNMTYLARSGVPGLVLWLGVLATWFTMLFHSLLWARRRGEEHWAKLFIWIGCYGLGMFVDACFDVALEGPMLGIWFWCVFGFGIGASMIFRSPLGRSFRHGEDRAGP